MSASVAVIMLLPQCNMTCSFCITEDSMGTFTLAQARGLLDRVHREGFKSVVLGGGEPLVWPHGTIELAEESRARGLIVQLGTNGILLKPGFEHSTAIDRYVLPLDGSSPAIHNSVRCYRDRHFELIMNRLDRLRAVGKSTTLSTVVTRCNEHDIARIATVIDELDSPRPFIHAWHLYQFIPEGRGGWEHRGALQIGANEYDRACASIPARSRGFRIFRRPDMLHSKSVEFFWVQGNQLHRQLGSTTTVEPMEPAA